MGQQSGLFLYEAPELLREWIRECGAFSQVHGVRVCTAGVHTRTEYVQRRFGTY